jgi:hypothetical protein
MCSALHCLRFFQYPLAATFAQPWRLSAAEGGGWLLRFRLGLTCQLSFSGEGGSIAAIAVAVDPPTGSVPALQSSVLQQLGGFAVDNCVLAGS